MPGIPQIAPYRMPTPGELPRNTVRWSVDPDRAVLLVHDMQEYFLDPFPGEPLDELLANAARLRERCAASGMPVAYTAQPGSMTPDQRGLLQDFWGPGMTTDAAHRRVVGPLAPEPEDWILTKWRYSAFHRTELLERMRAAGRDQLVVCGVYAHVGVLMTLCEAFSLDIQPFLVADAVADFSPEDHRMTVDYAARCCASVLCTEQLLADLPSIEVLV
jgi:trans-2,3-dihydro-3-hydroxyanthranilic acid synthase